MMPNRQADEGEGSFWCTSHRIGYDYRARFGDCQILKWADGVAFYLAHNHEGYALIADESSLASRLGSAEMPEPISIYLFRTEYARATYALRRGWWNGYKPTR